MYFASSFSVPRSLSTQSLQKWFDNNANKDTQPQKKQATDIRSQTKDVKPQTTDAKPHQNIAEAQKNQSHSPGDLPSATNLPAALSWAKLCDLAKFFNELTSADMEVKSGRVAFAGSRGVKEDEIIKEWNDLSGDERNKWEKRAAAECDIEG